MDNTHTHMDFPNFIHTHAKSLYYYFYITIMFFLICFHFKQIIFATGFLFSTDMTDTASSTSRARDHKKPCNYDNAVLPQSSTPSPAQDVSDAHLYKNYDICRYTIHVLSFARAVISRLVV